jgi:uroporphyrinogen decarboxylase
MLPRERVSQALDFARPDVIPVEYHASPAGSYEHGAKLHALWERYPEDFGDSRLFPRARPDAKFVDEQGRYQEIRRDEWGVLWKFLIFGVAGHPLERPLDDWENLAAYSVPPLPALSGEVFEHERRRAAEHQRTWFHKSGWIGIFEVLTAVRRFEDVLMEIADDSAEINRLADLIVDYQARRVEYLLSRGVDAIQFADDFGTQTSLILSPRVWKHFFQPRYARLMAPVFQAGKRVFFHTCGQSWGILNGLAELGVHAIWPQINVYNQQELAERCRSLHLALAVHPDRGDLMARSTPAQVSQEVYRLAEVFHLAEGGGWFYIEIDSGFPWENVQALIETVGRLRGL